MKIGMFRVSDIIGALIAILFLSALLYQININDLFRTIRSVSLPWVLASLCLFAVSMVLMSYRYWIIAGKNMNFSAFLRINIIQTVLGNTVSTGFGVFMYMVLMKKEAQVQVPNSLGVLILSRISDILVMLVSMAILIIASRAVYLTRLFSFISLFFLLGFAVLFLLIQFKEKLSELLNRLKNNYGKNYAIIYKIDDALSNFLYSYRLMNTKKIVYILLISFAYTTLLFFSLFCIANSFDFKFDIYSVFLVFTANSVVSLVPIQFMGGIGVMDFGSVYLYGILGYQNSITIPLMVSARLLFIMVNLFILPYIPISRWIELYMSKRVELQV